MTSVLRLGARQLDVVLGARFGTAHTRQGRVFGGADTYPASVLERVLDLGLVTLGDETVSGHRLVVTAAGWAALELHGQGDPRHALTLQRVTLGGSPIAGGGQRYGVVGRCSCGGRLKSNESGARGRDIVRRAHGEHVTAYLAAADAEILEPPK